MDRRSQLKNVAFGGAWSERIAGDEEFRIAMSMIIGASDRTVDEDLTNDADLANAIAIAASHHPKGEHLSDAWTRGLALPSAHDRVRELRRIGSLLAAASQARLDGR